MVLPRESAYTGNMNAQVQDAVVQWFVSHTSLTEDEIRKMANESYFEKGWIDSLAFISFVNDMEQQFGIRFSNSEFQGRAFSTVVGVTKVIEERLGKH